MMYTFLRFPQFRRKAVTLSYDDGVREDKHLIEIMNKNGLKGTFNINSELFGKSPEERRMTKEEVLELFTDSPHEVAIHGAKHLSLAEVDEAIATRDVIKDREQLDELFGRIIKGMAYSNGSYNTQTVEILKNCGISYARTTVATEGFSVPDDWLMMPTTCHHNHPQLMELAKQFLQAEESRYHWVNRPMLFYLWGHSYEFEDNNNWEIIEEFAKYIGNNPDIWYATNGELYDYVQAYTRLKYSVDGKIIYNPTSQDIYLCYYGKQVLIPAAETIKV